MGLNGAANAAKHASFLRPYRGRGSEQGEQLDLGDDFPVLRALGRESLKNVDSDLELPRPRVAVCAGDEHGDPELLKCERLQNIIEDLEKGLREWKDAWRMQEEAADLEATQLKAVITVLEERRMQEQCICLKPVVRIAEAGQDASKVNLAMVELTDCVLGDQWLLEDLPRLTSDTSDSVVGGLAQVAVRLERPSATKQSEKRLRLFGGQHVGVQDGDVEPVRDDQDVAEDDPGDHADQYQGRCAGFAGDNGGGCPKDGQHDER